MATAICKTCWKVLKTTRGGTTGMLKHMKSVHKICIRDNDKHGRVKKEECTTVTEPFEEKILVMDVVNK